MTTSRRSFMKLGVFGALTLASAGFVYRSLQQTPPPAPLTLDPDARGALRAITAVMLAGVLDKNAESALDAAMANTMTAISGLPLATQKELGDLLSLLLLAPTRRLLAGISSPWPEASPEEITRFLNSWRLHRFSLLQAGYFALHDLILGAWYAQPANWAAINYPGPMKELS